MGVFVMIGMKLDANKKAIQPLLLSVILLAGCAPMQTKHEAPTKPQTENLTCLTPDLSPLKQTKVYQVHGDIGISVASQTYECTLNKVEKLHRVKPTFSESMAASLSGINPNQMVMVEDVTRQEPKVEPSVLVFDLKINNKLNHVFRGAGAVVQINAAGKMIPVDQSAYESLTNAILPPRTEQDISIKGPPLSDLPDGATIGLFLDDVTTRTDAAGNPTRREHYEWYFHLSRKKKELVGTIRKKKVWLNPAAAAARNIQ